MTNHLSAGEHVRNVIGKGAQSLHTLKLLHHHCMSDDSLRHVYKAVVLSICTSIWLGLYTTDDPTLSQLAWTTIFSRTY